MLDSRHWYRHTSEDVNKVFDKFYQVKESGMKKPKGTGLGLAIVAEIVKLHDGKIWVESTLGKGSSFKFTLPVIPVKRTVPIGFRISNAGA